MDPEVGMADDPPRMADVLWDRRRLLRLPLCVVAAPI